MAILIIGSSKCGLCNKVLNDPQTTFSFPAFIASRKSRFFRYSNANFHRACLENDPQVNAVVSIRRQFAESVNPAKRTCAIDGSPIGKDEPYILLEYLADDENSILHRYALHTFKLANLVHWLQLGSLVKALEESKKTEPHMENYVNGTLRKIQAAVVSAGFSASPRRYRYIFHFFNLPAKEVARHLGDAQTQTNWSKQRVFDFFAFAEGKIRLLRLEITGGAEQTVSLELQRDETDAHFSAAALKLVEEQKIIRELKVNFTARPENVCSAVIDFRFYLLQQAVPDLPDYFIDWYDLQGFSEPFFEELAAKLQARRPE